MIPRRPGRAGRNSPLYACLRAPAHRARYANTSGDSLAVIARLLESSSVRVHVDRIFDLDQVADAHRTLCLGHTRGKLVLKVAEG